MEAEESQSALYQHDGTPPHNVRPIHKLSTGMFEDRWNANHGSFLWPTRCLDLTPIDF